MLSLYVYGEDGLTLWALKNRLPDILRSLDDHSKPSDCKFFYRPSFGRRGGANSSQFGEFDFLILAEERLYLGESKWDRSSELTKLNTIDLRQEQLTRHQLFAFYVREWAFREPRHDSWEDFVKKAIEHGPKPLAPSGSLLAENLRAILSIIENHFSVCPPIHNVLLYLYSNSSPVPVGVNGDFEIVPIKYPLEDTGNFIAIEI
jgi:hypothetical protein